MSLLRYLALDFSGGEAVRLGEWLDLLTAAVGDVTHDCFCLQTFFKDAIREKFVLHLGVVPLCEFGSYVNEPFDIKAMRAFGLCNSKKLIKPFVVEWMIGVPSFDLDPLLYRYAELTRDHACPQAD